MTDTDPFNFKDHEPTPPESRQGGTNFWDYEPNPVPTEPLSSLTDRERNRKMGNKIVAGAAGAAVGAGLAFGGLQIHNRLTSEGPEPHVTSGAKAVDTAEISSSPSPALVAEFEADFIDSSCDTPATARNAAEIYHEVFEAFDPRSMSETEFADTVVTVTDSLELAKSKLSFIPLPANYSDLLADVTTGHMSLPVDHYQAAFSEMIAPFGTVAHYNWEVMPGRAQDSRTTIPITHLSPEQSANLRTHLIGKMSAYAFIPVSVLEKANIKTYYFGDVIDKDSPQHSAAYANIGGAENSISTDIQYPISPNTARFIESHELAHPLQWETCKKMFDIAWHNQSISKHGSDNAEPLDKAWVRQFPENFKLSEDNADKLKEQYYLTDSNTTSLDYLTTTSEMPNPPEIIATRAYGTTNEFENFTTLVGEYSLDPTNTDVLFTAPERSTRLYEQLAVHLARMTDYDPESAQYFKIMLKIAFLENEASIRSGEAGEAYYKYIDSQIRKNLPVDHNNLPADVQLSHEASVRYSITKDQLQLLQTGATTLASLKGGSIENAVSADTQH